ncbi:MAG: hypothetical protein KJ792_11050 [Actinobacteria bacterium]|nr:hypothetical protein [Actinomycetota bacterium]
MRTPEPVAIRWTSAFVDLPDDVHDLGVAFWRSVTGSSLSAPRGDRGQFATLLPGDGDPYLRVQRLAGAPRVHLDLHVDDVRAAARQAEALGARVLVSGSHVVMGSPGGFVFCFVVDRQGHRRPSAVTGALGGRSLVDQLALDAPTGLATGEVAFWSSLTGWSPDADVAGVLVPLVRPAGIPLRLMVQRLGADDDRTQVSGHLDVAAGGPDRRVVVAEHVDLGARVLHEAARWTVLRDPAGAVYCLTDRDPATGRLPDGPPRRLG